MSRSEEALIEGCIRQDASCQKELYERYARKLFGLCMRYASDTAEADDIYQEAIIKVFQNLETFRGESRFDTWVRRIVVNTALNYLRRKKSWLEYRDEETLPESEVPEFEVKIGEDGIKKEELMDLVQELPDGYRTVFNLYVFEGLTHQEIGEELGISENTSKSQLSRARKQLQERVKGLLKERYGTERPSY